MRTYIYNKKFGKSVVHRTVLDNGVNVFTAPLQSSMATTKVVFPSGSCEDGEYPGTAHYLEHMLMKGPNDDGVHPAMISLLPLGVEGNASTGFVKIDFYLSGFAPDFELMMQALPKISLLPSFTKKQVERERGVIIQEAMEDARNDAYVAWFHSRAFPQDVSLHQPIIGNLESINKIDIDILHDYMKREIVLSRAAFIASGGISHEKHLELVIRNTEKLPNHINQRVPGRLYDFIPFCGEYTDTRIDHAKLHLIFSLPHNIRVKRLLNLASDMLTDDKWSILFSNLRNKHRLVYDVESTLSDAPFSFLDIETQCAANDIDKVINLMLEGIEQLKNCQIPQKLFDLIMVKRRMSLLLRDEEVDRYGQIDWIKDVWLQNEYEDIDLRELDLSITLQEIADAAKKYLTPENMSIVKVLPET
jgi:predicted Zn-dependent peptidase